MTKATQTISIGLLVSSIYLACFLELIPFSPKIQQEVIPVIPFWGLVSFGAYLLFKLGWGVFTFNDIPGAYDSLMKEIAMAKKDLKSKGVDVD